MEKPGHDPHALAPRWMGVQRAASDARKPKAATPISQATMHARGHGTTMTQALCVDA